MGVAEDTRSETFQTTDPVTLSLRIPGGQILVRATETFETRVELEALNEAAREVMPRVRIEGRPRGERFEVVVDVPQQRGFDRDAPLRGCDLVRLGLDGHRWGLGLTSKASNERVRRALQAVGADGYGELPVGRLSGGEQQRLRIAQALVSDPALLLADEPLLSLDLSSQRTVVDLLDRRRRESGTPVVFVTHDVNPILRVADTVLYLAPGRWAIGPPAEVLTTETLSRLYDTPVDVLRVRGRVVVVGTPDDDGIHHHDHASAGSH